MGAAWARHAMCESAFTRSLEDLQNFMLFGHLDVGQNQEAIWS